jgi:hypothetical protein
MAQGAYCLIFAPEAFGPSWSFTDGAGGFSPGVPLGCLGM